MAKIEKKKMITANLNLVLNGVDGKCSACLPEINTFLKGWNSAKHV